jgi:hypothetical protein
MESGSTYKWLQNLVCQLPYRKASELSVKGKSITITGRGGLEGCEMLRIPHCPDNRLKNGGEVVSLMHWLRSIPHKHFLFLSLVLTFVRGCKPQDPTQPERSGKVLRFNYHIGSQTCELPACSIVSRPQFYCMPH